MSSLFSSEEIASTKGGVRPTVNPSAGKTSLFSSEDRGAVSTARPGLSAHAAGPLGSVKATASLFSADERTAANAASAKPPLFANKEHAAASAAPPVLSAPTAGPLGSVKATASLFSAGERAAVNAASAKPPVFGSKEQTSEAPISKPPIAGQTKAFGSSPVPSASAPQGSVRTSRPSISLQSGLPCGDVTVTDPQKEGAMSKHVSYLVSGTIFSERFSARKRYADFEWLRLALLAHFPGVLVPQLPKKRSGVMGFISKNQQGVTEDRKAGLEEFLRQLLCRRSLVCESPLVKRFLETGDAALESLKKEMDARPLRDVLNEFRASFVHELQSCAAPSDDSRFVEMKNFLDNGGYIDQLGAVVVAAAQLAEEQKKATESIAAATSKIASLTEMEGQISFSADVVNSFGRGVRSEFLSMLQSRNEAVADNPSHPFDVLLCATERDLTESESMLDALRSIESLQTRLAETRRRVEKSERQHADATRRASGQSAPPSEESSPAADPQARTSAPSTDKARDMMSRMSLQRTSLEDLAATVARDNDDIVNGEELYRACRVVCLGSEIPLYLENKLQVQRWLNDEFSKQCSDNSKGLLSIWHRAGETAPVSH